MLNRTGLGTCTRWSRTQKIASSFLFHRKTYADWKEPFKLTSSLDLVSKYNEQTTKQILDVLNNTNVEEMKRYNVTKARVLKMARYQKTNGPFKSIEQVLEVDDFGVKVLEKLVASIAEGSSKKDVVQKPVDYKPFLKTLNTITTPNLSDEKRLTIKTVTSIIFGMQHISWAKIDTSGRVLSWNSYEKYSWPRKDDPMVLRDLALKVWDKLPTSDIYVAEGASTPQSSSMIKPGTMLFNSQRVQLTAMLLMLLATEFSPPNENDPASWTAKDNFYFLKRSVTAQLFSLVVGGETISACEVISQMMDDRVPKSLEHIPPVTIDFIENNIFDKSDPTKKDAMSHALLLSIAFMDLAVNRNIESLNALDLRNKKR